MTDFIVLDECHHGFSNNTFFLQERNENILKLTATLNKQENIRDVIFYYPVSDAIQNGYLCDYKLTIQMFEK